MPTPRSREPPRASSERPTSQSRHVVEPAASGRTADDSWRRVRARSRRATARCAGRRSRRRRCAARPAAGHLAAAAAGSTPARNGAAAREPSGGDTGAERRPDRPRRADDRPAAQQPGWRAPPGRSALPQRRPRSPGQARARGAAVAARDARGCERCGRADGVRPRAAARMHASDRLRRPRDGGRRRRGRGRSRSGRRRPRDRRSRLDPAAVGASVRSGRSDRVPAGAPSEGAGAPRPAPSPGRGAGARVRRARRRRHDRPGAAGACAGSTYPSAAADTRIPRWTYGDGHSVSPLGPAMPTGSPSATVGALRDRDLAEMGQGDRSSRRAGSSRCGRRTARPRRTTPFPLPGRAPARRSTRRRRRRDAGRRRTHRGRASRDGARLPAAATSRPTPQGPRRSAARSAEARARCSDDARSTSCSPLLATMRAELYPARRTLSNLPTESGGRACCGRHP